MAFLYGESFNKLYSVSRDEVKSFLKDNKLPFTRPNRKLAQRRIRASKIRRTIGKDISILESAGNWQVIYGETKCGGTITFAHTTENNRYLHLVVTLAGHEIESIEELYLDNQKVIFASSGDTRWSVSVYDEKTGLTHDATNKIFMDLNDGNTSNAAIASLITDCPTKWTSLHKQKGRAHVYIKLVWNALLFPNGLPDISFKVRGKKCYDPRTATTYWTQNTALHMLDYLTNADYGLGVSLSEIEITEDKVGSFFNAANICDEDVSLLAGGTEKRYTSNGVFEVGEPHQTILEELSTAIAGSLTFSNGKWKCFPAKWTEPVINLTESDIISGINVTTRISRRDNFNAVKGTYVNPLSDYEEVDFPAVRNALYKSQDNNEENFADIQLPFTQSGTTAQRIAKIELERIRQPITVELTANLKALQVEAGENITIDWDRFGWSEKEFLVEETEIIIGANSSETMLAVKLFLRETAEGVFDWNNGEETTIDLAPNSELPRAITVQVPTGLTLESGTDQLYIRSDGTVFSRLKVSWNALDDYFVSSGGFIEVAFKRSIVSAWNLATQVPSDIEFTHILDVYDGQSYDVKIRSRNAFGVASSWSDVVTHTVIGKTEKPSFVSGFSGQLNPFGIKLEWTAISDLDLAFYRIKIGDTDDSWSDANFLIDTKATSYFVEIKLADTYRFMIKAFDTSGNESDVSNYFDTVIAQPSTPNPFSSIISGVNILLSWGESTGYFNINEYVLKENDVEITRVKGTKYQFKAIFEDTKTYTVTAIDVAGNESNAASLVVAITAPSQVNSLTSEVVDNNVLLRWQAPTTGTLPIDHYKVYKGDIFDEASLVGQVSGTFSALFEIISGAFIYWVVGVDSAGNVGEERAITANVNEPPDFIINADALLDVTDATYINVIASDGLIIAPAYNNESYESHFLNNGFTTWQDAIDAGNTYFLQPTPPHGYWEQVIDYGALMPASLIKLSFTQTNISGALDLTIKLAHSTDGTSWTETEGLQAYSSSFQYVRVRLEFGTLPGVSGEAMGVLGLTYP